MKRTLSIILALVLATALIACPVLAANGDGNGNGGGNGEKQVEVSSVKVGDKDLKDAEVAISKRLPLPVRK